MFPLWWSVFKLSCCLTNECWEILCLFWIVVGVVQSLSRVRLFATPRTAAHQTSPEVCSDSCPLSWWCHPAISSSVTPFSSCPQSFPASGSFPRELSLRIRWPKYWSFSFSISPSNEYSGLISFRIGWFDLAVQGTLKSLLQHHTSKASILACSAFFMV